MPFLASVLISNAAFAHIAWCIFSVLWLYFATEFPCVGQENTATNNCWSTLKVHYPSWVKAAVTLHHLGLLKLYLAVTRNSSFIMATSAQWWFFIVYSFANEAALEWPAFPVSKQVWETGISQGKPWKVTEGEQLEDDIVWMLLKILPFERQADQNTCVATACVSKYHWTGI